MKKAMLLYGTGVHHAEMHELTLPSKEQYAIRHGYELIAPDVPKRGRGMSWEKVSIMAGLLNAYDAVLFLGADVFIANGNYDIAANVPPEAAHALVVHDIDEMGSVPRVGYVPNCDVWLVYKKMVPWLEEIEQMSVRLEAHPWWEQAACMLLMGFSIEFPCVRAEKTELWSLTYELDHRFNHHPNAKCLGKPYFWHATGHPIPTRLKMLREWTA